MAAEDSSRGELCDDAEMAAVVFRPATAADVDALSAVAVAAYRHYVPRIGREPAPMTADYARVVRDDEVWVAVPGVAIAGFVVLVREPDHLLIENLAVLPSAQGRGIGAGLLGLAEERARQYGVAELRLYTNEAMTENLAYYPRHGYTETHRAQQDGFRRVFFVKPLTDSEGAGTSVRAWSRRKP
jgi:ribosomal protein S18 acetylase RimI-like enzyme